MQYPSNEVIYEFGLRKGLMATLVGDDPQSRAEESSNEAVECPERDAGGGI